MTPKSKMLRKALVPGTVVWAHLKGYPWWPARIVDRETHEKKVEKYQDLPPARADNRMVEFFYDENRVDIINVRNIKEYKSYNYLIRAPSYYFADIRKACAEAEQFIRLRENYEQLPTQTYVFDRDDFSENIGKLDIKKKLADKIRSEKEATAAPEKSESLRISLRRQDGRERNGQYALVSHSRSGKDNLRVDPGTDQSLSPSLTGKRKCSQISDNEKLDDHLGNGTFTPLPLKETCEVLCLNSIPTGGNICFESVKRWKFSAISAKDLIECTKEQLLKYISEQSMAMKALQVNLEHARKELATERERLRGITQIINSRPGN